MNGYVLTILLFVIAQILTWIQSNGQFMWESYKKYPFLIAFLFGGITSYLFALAHKHCYALFNGVVWPGRMFSFSSGIVIFTIMTWLFLGEAITLKTFLSIFLAALIIVIQFYL